MPAFAIGPVLKPELDVGMDPVHESPPEPPLAVQEAALLLDHASVVLCPVVSVVGLAVKLFTTAAVGGALVTLTTTEAGVPAPPGPVQVRVYWYIPGVASTPVLKPLLAVPTGPFHCPVPVSPLPVHDVALLVDQDSDAA